VARSGPGAWPGRRPGAFSARVWAAELGTQHGQKSGEVAADAAGCQLGGWEWPLPGQALVGDQGAGEPELPEGEASSQVQRSAEAGSRGRTVVQPEACLRNRNPCSTVNRKM